MAVTEEQRTTLSRELDRALGNEAAVILMAHLPVGGAQSVATREDIGGLRVDIDGLRAATREDIGGLRVDIDGLRAATREDIGGLREDIDGLREEFRAELRGGLALCATKEDLLGMARRQELEALRNRMDNGFAEQQTFNLVVLDRFGALDSRITGLAGAVTGLADSFRAEFRGELMASVASQTRTLLLALVTTVLAISGMAIALVTAA